jgi:hypothetical protein
MLALGVQELTIDGVSSDMTADLTLNVEDSFVRLELHGRRFQVKALANAVTLDRVSAYMDVSLGHPSQ